MYINIYIYVYIYISARVRVNPPWIEAMRGGSGLAVAPLRVLRPHGLGGYIYIYIYIYVYIPKHLVILLLLGGD